LIPALVGASLGTGVPPTNYFSISTATVTSGGYGTITFSSIPATYTHLQLRIFGRNDTALQNMRLRFNSDSSTSSYRWHYLYGDGTSAGAGDGGTGAGNSDSIYLGNSPTTANIFAGVVVDILDYANTSKNKTTRSLHGYNSLGSGVIQLLSGLWMNTAAINSISIFPLTNQFAQYSQIELYGVK